MLLEDHRCQLLSLLHMYDLIMVESLDPVISTVKNHHTNSLTYL